MPRSIATNTSHMEFVPGLCISSCPLYFHVYSLKIILIKKCIVPNEIPARLGRNLNKTIRNRNLLNELLSFLFLRKLEEIKHIGHHSGSQIILLFFFLHIIFL